MAAPDTFRPGTAGSAAAAQPVRLHSASAKRAVRAARSVLRSLHHIGPTIAHFEASRPRRRPTYARALHRAAALAPHVIVPCDVALPTDAGAFGRGVSGVAALDIVRCGAGQRRGPA